MKGSAGGCTTKRLAMTIGANTGRMWQATEEKSWEEQQREQLLPMGPNALFHSAKHAMNRNFLTNSLNYAT